MMLRRVLKFYFILICIIPLLLIIIFLIYLFGGLFIAPLFEEKGGYRVEYVNSDVNPCKDEERYFYLYGVRSLRSFSFATGITEEFVSCSDEDDSITGFAVWEEYIYYIVKHAYYVEGRGYRYDFELWKLNYETGEQTMLISKEDMLQFNNGEPLGNKNCYVDVCGNYIFLGLTSGFEYMCPIDGNILTDSFDVDTLFPEEDKSGELQKVVFDGIQVERYFYGERYLTKEIRDEDGVRILVESTTGNDNYVFARGEKVNFRKEHATRSLQYSLGEKERWEQIHCLQGNTYEKSDIFNYYLTVEDGKIIGLLCVSKHPLNTLPENTSDIRKDILFELDIETGESRILYDTKNNRTKIIGYREGIVYVAKKGKVYSQYIDGSEWTELFALPDGNKYYIEWQAGYLIIKLNRYDDVIKVYNTID